MIRIIILLTSIIALTGCAAGVATQTPPQPTSAPAMRATPTLSARATAIPTRASTSGASATPTVATGLVQIEVAEFYFYPELVTIKVGTTVEWVPIGSHVHTINSKKNSPLVINGNIGTMGGHRYQMTFQVPGIYQYECLLHPGVMDAMIEVVN
jgi:plastocyanin